MRKSSSSLIIFSGFLAFILLVGFISPAAALPIFTSSQTGLRNKWKPHPGENPGRVHMLPPRLSVNITPNTFSTQVGLGQPFTLEGFINDQNGKPVPNKSITFRIDGFFLGRARSNEVGLFKHKFNNTFSAGTYLITASSTETHLFQATSTATTLKITPAVVHVQTVPPMAGVPFLIAGQRFVSGSDGLATTNINRPGIYRLDVLTVEYHNPSNRIEFARWIDDASQPSKFIKVPSEQVIQVGFNVYHQVGQSFLGLDGLPVTPQRVTEFTIRSAQGDMFVFHDGQPRWIPASRIARWANGLEETKLLYSILSVTVDGSNVVNSSQQRFFTYPTENWPISLLLYSIHISATDGLFGTPIGKSVNLVFPNGTVENYPLDSAGTADIHSLARGNYVTELVGIHGLSSRTPVALSRNQVITTKVITYTDLAVVGFLGAFVALGLLLYGRPRIFFVWEKTGRLIPMEQELAVVPVALPEQVLDYRQMRYESLKLLEDKDFKVWTGVERELFEKMHAFFVNYSETNGNKARLSEADQILMTILFLQGHRTHAEVGQIYFVSETTTRRTIKKVKKAMHEFIQSRQVEENTSQPETAIILTDMFETTGQPIRELTNNV